MGRRVGAREQGRVRRRGGCARPVPCPASFSEACSVFKGLPAMSDGREPWQAHQHNSMLPCLFTILLHKSVSAAGHHRPPPCVCGPATCCTQDALRRAMEDNPELSKEFEAKLAQKVRLRAWLPCDFDGVVGGCFEYRPGTLEPVQRLALRWPPSSSSHAAHVLAHAPSRVCS